MRERLFIGLDVGTTQVKAGAFGPDGERPALARRSYSTHYPQPGWAEQSPEDWKLAARECLIELVAGLGSDVGRVAGIGLSAHAPSLIPVDSQGRSLIERVPIWQDERAVQQARRLLGEIGADWVGLGMPFASFAAKLAWYCEEQPALAESAAYALGVKAFLAHWLTGAFATDPSSEPGNTPEWAVVCRACGWPIDRLPPVLPPATIVGSLRDDVAKELGLPRSLPVALGLNDGGSAVLASGATRPGEGVITLSTNGVAFLVSDGPVPAEGRLRRAIFCWPYLDGRWIIGGQTKAGAASLQWLAQLLAGGSGEAEILDQLLADAAASPVGSLGVMFFPYLLGQGTPRDNPQAKAGFSGLTLRSGRGDLTRAVLEGVAFAVREALEELEQHSPAIIRLSISGGGARSPLWRQITSDALGVPLGYSDSDSCLGAAMLVAVALGAFPDAASAAMAMARTGEDTLPDPEAVASYAALYEQFCRHRDAQVAFYWT